MIIRGMKQGGESAVDGDVITSYMNDINTAMSKISSLVAKVELLENIFSLLFIRRSDMKEEHNCATDNDIDSDNISMGSTVSRNMSRSFDSLSMSASMSADDFLESGERGMKKGDVLKMKGALLNLHEQVGSFKSSCH